MAATDRTTTEQAAPLRARTGNPAVETPVPVRARGPGLINQMIENPLLSLFGAVIVVLLGFVLTTSSIRISETNDRISETNDRITSLETRIDQRITSLETRIDQRIDRLEGRMDRLEDRIVSLESGVAGIDRKLTALIAALGVGEEVDNTLSG